MGIARAIERVKRQAKSGGLQGVIAGLGKELRSEQIPVPLRAAAERIARLLPAERGGVAPPQPEALQAKTTYVAVTKEVQPAPVESVVPTLGETAREGLSATGTDSGVEPGPLEPDDDTPVDPETVGATPIVNASPIEVAPLDASPVEVAPLDASPIEIAPTTHNPIVAQLAPDDVAVAPAKPKASRAAHVVDTSDDVAVAASVEKTEEELAPDGEEAKNLARSTPRRAKKRSGSKGTTTSKKK
jgi:hypothetical protein